MTPASSPAVSTPTWLQRRAVALIEMYQRAFEGRPSPCRFTPSCSSYAHEAFTEYGTARGLTLTARRLVRCRPFGPSGYDPVPERGANERDHHGEHRFAEKDS